MRLFYDRIPGTMERPKYLKGFNVYDYVDGNIGRLDNALSNKETLYFLDIDGICANSGQRVFEDFNLKYGTNYKPHDIDRWNYLSYMAIVDQLGSDVVEVAEKGWFKKSIISKSQRYMFSRPAVVTIVNHAGADRTFVMTARHDGLKDITKEFFEKQYPMIHRWNIKFEHKKGIAIRNMSTHYGNPPIVFIDDAESNIREVLKEVPNAVCISVPLGVSKPEFNNDRAIVIGRHPHEDWQGMYPLYRLIEDRIAKISQMSHNVDISLTDL